MCLIIHKPANASLPLDKLLTVWKNNPDGLGIMFPSSKKRVIVQRVLPESFEEVEALLSKYKDRDIGIHFRWRTSGLINKAMAHPFKILNYKTHGTDLYMMHNGVLNCVDEYKKEASDTWHFVEDYLYPLLNDYGPDILRDVFFRDLLAKYIGVSNKLLFVDSEGRWTFINKKAGNDLSFEGCWISNTYSLNPTHRGHSKIYPVTPIPVASKVTNVIPLDTKPTYKPNVSSLGQEIWYWDMPEQLTKVPPLKTPDQPKLFEEPATEEEVHANNTYVYGEQSILDFKEMDYPALFQWIISSPEKAAALLRDCLSLTYWFEDTIHDSIEEKKKEAKNG